MSIPDSAMTDVYQVPLQFGEKIAVQTVFVIDVVLNLFLYFGLNCV